MFPESFENRKQKCIPVRRCLANQEHRLDQNTHGLRTVQHWRLLESCQRTSQHLRGQVLGISLKVTSLSPSLFLQYHPIPSQIPIAETCRRYYTRCQSHTNSTTLKNSVQKQKMILMARIHTTITFAQSPDMVCPWVGLKGLLRLLLAQFEALKLCWRSHWSSVSAYFEPNHD